MATDATPPPPTGSTPPPDPPAPPDRPGSTPPADLPPPPPPPPAQWASDPATAPGGSASSPFSAAAETGAPVVPLVDDQSSSTPIEEALFEVKRVVVGQQRMLERILVCLLAGGHCLLEGVPGIAKTLSVETLAKVVGGSFVRLQFTPDMLPADIVGTRIWRGSTETFDVELGPLRANMVLADEINRAPAKVQSALLEAMAERQISIGGQTFPLPQPFIVLATQNPIESEGVYPLPEAQQDRFLMKIVIDYPTPAEEVEIVQRMGVNPPEAGQVLRASTSSSEFQEQVSQRALRRSWRRSTTR